ncbi:MAG: hypothetical protein K1Y02_04600 [Candidatus Hydrogenedentes bacterium]|nr:hypothetical protein [Candidatus Hydrogenedentota bacterium]
MLLSESGSGGRRIIEPGGRRGVNTLAAAENPFRRVMRRALPFAAMSAVLLIATSCDSPTPGVEAASLFERKVEGNLFDTTPVRGELRPLRHRRSGFEYRCSECHTSIQSPRHQNEFLGEHRNIVLDHGANLYCVNCHHPVNRNAYVDHDGSEISSTTPALLCRKCHGPTYREWELGIHGRQNGYWDKEKGERTKLLCIQCHDPHSPRFKAMKPEPAPARTRFDRKGEESHS